MKMNKNKKQKIEKLFETIKTKCVGERVFIVTILKALMNVQFLRQQKTQLKL